MKGKMKQDKTAAQERSSVLGCDWTAAAASSCLSHPQTNGEPVGVIGRSLGVISQTLTSQNTNVVFLLLFIAYNNANQ